MQITNIGKAKHKNKLQVDETIFKVIDNATPRLLRYNT